MIQSDLRTIKGKKVPVLVTEAVKLKRPKKVAMHYDLKEVFGFVPSRIVIQLESGRNNSYHLIAIDENGESKRGAELLKALKKDDKKTTKETNKTE